MYGRYKGVWPAIFARMQTKRYWSVLLVKKAAQKNRSSLSFWANGAFTLDSIVIK